MKSAIRRVLLLSALMSPNALYALGLGEIHLHSALNQPFDADIDLVSAADEDLSALRASLASNEVFGRYGIDKPAFLADFTFRVVRGTGGKAYLKVTSPRPVTEPFVTMLVEADWQRADDHRGGLKDVWEQFVNVAFALRDEEPIGGPLVTRDAVYIIAKHKQIPSEIPAYEAVKDKVASDYKQSEALAAARSAANEFVAKATNAIAEGKGKRVALFLIGYDPDLIASYKMEGRFATPNYYYFAGGHDLYGREKEPLDLAALLTKLTEIKGQVDALAVSSYFSPLNPEHENGPASSYA